MIRGAILILSLVFIQQQLFADSLNTIDLTNASIQGISNCLHYEYKGFCVWRIDHKPWVETSFYVSHYLPDIVVNVFQQPDQDPYTSGHLIDEAFFSVFNPLAKSLVGNSIGGGQSHASSFNELNDRMKDVSILPNPGILFYQMLPFPLIQSLASMSLSYYYDSIPDILMWRSGAAELDAETLIKNGEGNIGDWGSMYAQEGIINAADNYIDSAVVAMRAVGLIDEGGSYASSHGRAIRNKLPYKCATDNCHASHITPNSDDIKWQLVYPKISNKCIRFGKDSVLTVKGNTKNTPEDISEGNISWLMWRRYEGCVPHRGKLISTIKW